MRNRNGPMVLSRLSFMGAVAMTAGVILSMTLTYASAMAEPSTSLSSRRSEVKAGRTPTLTPQGSGTTNRLQAISPVNSRVVWASGVGGTYALTTDGGATWRARVVPGAEDLEFRDIHGVSKTVAYLLAAGAGTASRIYSTQDGGESWALQFENQDPNGFYDCFAFWSPTRGITMADSVAGRFPVIKTTNGKTWNDIGDQLPPALSGEAAFAASGTCVATQGAKHAWIATGAAEKARVLATTNSGKTWAAYDTPIVQGTASSGGFSVAFRDARHGILGGGDLAAPTETSNNFARSRNGGKTWHLGAPTPFPGAIFGLAYAKGGDQQGVAYRDDGDDDRARGGGGDGARVTVVATGPGGASWSPDEGDTWFSLAGVTNYWAVAFASPSTGWLVGTQGRILRVDFGAAAAATLDQSQELSDSFSSYQPHNLGTAGGTGLAQTFTAGISGELRLIELEVSRFVVAGTTEALTVEIRAGDPTGALLSTASVAAASIPASPAFAWIPVSFATPATVTAGEAYAIVLPPGPFTGATDPAYFWTIAFADVYVNGVAWDHYRDSGVWESYVFGSDRTFRTYVSR
jgi:photosystem II stability/assembly factor-like uncharacterized protein